MGAYVGAFLSLSRCGYVVVVAQDVRGTGDREPGAWKSQSTQYIFTRLPTRTRVSCQLYGVLQQACLDRGGSLAA